VTVYVTDVFVETVSVWLPGAVSTKSAAFPPLRTADTMIWLPTTVSAGDALTTIDAEGGVPVVVLQFKVTELMIVPPTLDVANRLALSKPDPAVSANSTGKICRA
jgi:hypothetical protein